ncbi:Histidine kinase [Saliniradius amylolyticus]|uniref:histidine kinase n=1 Tax=Saliniradius amylolyticus TaxID=2183582 RepID=A0A2S2E228_9ALTE|nr:ATP-binding protein [Saliniradius amylolyticus]AWL11705.1 Histidine kinase [Saliniradius amylolyticus]
MIKLSLKLRTFLAALVVLVVFVPLTAFTLERAFTNSLSQSIRDQLELQTLALISEFEMQNNEVRMPQRLFDNRMNLPGSGTYAFISLNKLAAWQSASAVNWSSQPDLHRPPVGQAFFGRQSLQGNTYFQYSYTAEFADGGRIFPVTFHTLQEGRLFDQELSAFRQTLWRWLGAVAAALILVLALSLRAALNPISRLDKSIQAMEQGRIQRLDDAFPPELHKLTDSLNHLLDSEQQQRQRYHNSLGDLAHSLKTPLAVLKGLNTLPEQAQEPVSQIEHIINRQLKRAVAGAGSGLQSTQPIKPVADALLRAMDKIYQARQLNLNSDISDSACVPMDKTDLNEVLGNLLDNGCKAARSQVTVFARREANLWQLGVEDDGPGITEEQQQQLLARGQRLDTYRDGQGLGLALVADIAHAYHGELHIEPGSLGGARVFISVADDTKTPGASSESSRR